MLAPIESRMRFSISELVNLISPRFPVIAQYWSDSDYPCDSDKWVPLINALIILVNPANITMCHC